MDKSKIDDFILRNIEVLELLIRCEDKQKYGNLTLNYHCGLIVNFNETSSGKFHNKSKVKK